MNRMDCKTIVGVDNRFIGQSIEEPGELIPQKNFPKAKVRISNENSVGMTMNNFRRQFVCIEYPGFVQNVDKMLKTLGGLDSISNTVDRQKLRMELRYRPDDAYCKPVCGNKQQISGLLLRVVIRRPKGEQPVISSATVVGQVQTTYRFRTLCDFQYLATDGKECIYKSLIPHDLPRSEWLFEDSDYFLPPPAFSRMDVPQAYQYRRDKAVEAPRDVIGCTRPRRAGHAVFAAFDAEVVPSAPRPLTLRVAQAKGLAEPLLKVKQLFESRAIWSKSALLSASQLPADQLKMLLPCVAYYAVTGPWRIMWVRFGYDPRKDYAARTLQALDFRLRTAGGLKTKVKAKRSYSNYVLPYKSAPLRGKAALAGNRPTTVALNDHIFRPGVLPPSRQMFYQYCDLHVAEIQTMLEKLPPPLPGAICHERHGWLPPGLDDQCRDILHAVVLETLRSLPGEISPGKNLKASALSEEEDEESFGDDDEEWEEAESDLILDA